MYSTCALNFHEYTKGYLAPKMQTLNTCILLVEYNIQVKYSPFYQVLHKVNSEVVLC